MEKQLSDDEKSDPACVAAKAESDDEFHDSEETPAAGETKLVAADVFVEFADHEKNAAAAQEKKAAGNVLFAAQDYVAAAQCYTDAVAYSTRDTSDAAVFLANRAACHLKLGNLDECERDCTAALEVQPAYVKALLRRATAREKLERLEDALADACVDLLHSRAADYQSALAADSTCSEGRAAVARLPAQIEAQREKLKTEMFGKLKELGNMCLRPFGLSTDNFQMVKDPVSGGYSMNFSQGGARPS